MGAQMIMVFGFLGSLSIISSVSSLFLSMTNVWFFGLGMKLFVLQIRLLGYEIPAGSDLCTVQAAMQYVSKHAPKLAEDFCGGSPITGDLQAVYQRICETPLKAFIPDMCLSLENAYVFGFVLTGVIVLNAVLELTAVLLLFSYISSSTPKQAYRFNAMLIHGLSTLILFAGMLVYWATFLQYINQNTANSGILGAIQGMVFSANGELGYSWGSGVLCTSLVLQFMMIIVGCMVSTSKELSRDELLDLKEQAKLESMEGPSYGTPQTGGAYYQPGPVMVPQAAPYAQPVVFVQPQAGFAQPQGQPMPYPGGAPQPAW